MLMICHCFHPRCMEHGRCRLFVPEENGLTVKRVSLVYLSRIEVRQCLHDPELIAHPLNNLHVAFSKTALTFLMLNSVSTDTRCGLRGPKSVYIANGAQPSTEQDCHTANQVGP